LSWSINLITPSEIILNVAKEIHSCFASENSLEFPLGRVYEAFLIILNFSFSEYNIYRKFDLYTLAISCLIIAIENDSDSAFAAFLMANFSEEDNFYITCCYQKIKIQIETGEDGKTETNFTTEEEDNISNNEKSENEDFLNINNSNLANNNLNCKSQFNQRENEDNPEDIINVCKKLESLENNVSHFFYQLPFESCKTLKKNESEIFLSSNSFHSPVLNLKETESAEEEAEAAFKIEYKLDIPKSSFSNNNSVSSDNSKKNNNSYNYNNQFFKGKVGCQNFSTMLTDSINNLQLESSFMTQSTQSVLFDLSKNSDLCAKSILLPAEKAFFLIQIILIGTLF